MAASSALTSVTLFLEACSPEPTAKVTNWQLERSKDNKSYLVKADVSIENPRENGFFHPTISFVFTDGCQRMGEGLATIIAQGTRNEKIEYKIVTPRKVYSAAMTVRFDEDVSEPSRNIFSEDRVIDGSTRPPDFPKVSCSSTPSGSSKDANSDLDIDVQRAGKDEVIATAINSAGYLCARVTDSYLDSGRQMIVHCNEYRTGRGRVKYRIDPDAGNVVQVD